MTPDPQPPTSFRVRPFWEGPILEVCQESKDFAAALFRALCKPKPGFFYVSLPFRRKLFACHTLSVVIGIAVGQLFHIIYYTVLYLFVW